MFDDTRIAKLPMWAQDHIKHLNQKLEDAELFIRAQSKLALPDSRTGIILNPYSERPLLLSDQDTVQFWIEPDVFAIDVDMRASTWKAKGVLNIMGQGYGKSSRIFVCPGASNCLSIGGEQ